MTYVKTTDYIANFLYSVNVRTVPVFQGGNIMHLIDSIGEHPGLRYICPHHEQSLAMIVESYARQTGFGVGVVTSGPGLTNIVTGVADAFYDSIPCLFLVGQVGTYHCKGNRGVRQRGFQETDSVGLFESITKLSKRVSSVESVVSTLNEAYRIATSGRPGPVVLEIPYDVQIAKIRVESSGKLEAETSVATSSSQHDLHLHTDNIITRLLDSERPVVVAGGGVVISKQCNTLRKICADSDLPLVATWPAAGIMDEDSPTYFGCIGRSGQECAKSIVDAADMVLILGSRLNPKAAREDILSKKKHSISIDIDAHELSEGLVKAELGIRADLSLILPTLSARLTRQKYRISYTWKSVCIDLKLHVASVKRELQHRTNDVDPLLFFNQISEWLPHETTVVLDTGCNQAWAMQGLRQKRGQRFLSAFGHSPMGFALPAIIGSHFAQQDRYIFAVIGDGGFQLNIGDLHLIAKLDINVLIILVNNQSLGNTFHPSTKNFEGRGHGSTPEYGYTCPDFKLLTNAFGLRHYIYDGSTEPASIFNEVFSYKGPKVVELVVDPQRYPSELW